MINEYKVKRYCFEDISLIENYYEAINDKEHMWHCHHKLEIELNKTISELKELNLYYNRPANELQFLTRSEHKSLHMQNNNYGRKLKGYHRTEESKQKMRKPKSEEHRQHMKGPKPKHKWLTPTGEIVEMYKSPVKRFHPDWTQLD